MTVPMRPVSMFPDKAPLPGSQGQPPFHHRQAQGGTDASAITTGTLAAARIGAHASTHQTGGSDAVGNVVVSPTQLSANTNDWSIGTGDVFRISSSAAVNVTGIVAGSSGQSILLTNVGSNAITFKHQSTSSTAANRLLIPWGGDCVIPADSSAVLAYDGTTSRWRVV